MGLATARTAPLPPRPAENTVAIERAHIASASEERRVRKEQARAAYEKALVDADKILARAIKRAHKKRVPWLDITAAAGMSRQVANDLLRQV